MLRLAWLVVVLGVCAPRWSAAQDKPVEVQVQMRNVALHVDDATILQIARLRGALVSTEKGRPPIFDDKNSFVVRIDSAEIALTMESLTRLLNNHVFHYEGSPLKGAQRHR
jgi:hypothetical protein